MFQLGFTTEGSFHFNSLTAMTASVRLLTFKALRTALTWLFTVGSVRSSTRQMALLLIPCIMSDSTATCRSVRPRSAGEGLSASGAVDGVDTGGNDDCDSALANACGGM